MSKHYVSKKNNPERFTLEYIEVHECSCRKNRGMRWLHFLFFVVLLVLIYWLITKKNNN